jgi:hypothetical protein
VCRAMLQLEPQHEIRYRLIAALRRDRPRARVTRKQAADRKRVFRSPAEFQEVQDRMDKHWFYNSCFSG